MAQMLPWQRQKAEIILGLYKCNYSLTVKELKLILGPLKADVAPGENEFDTPVLKDLCESNVIVEMLYRKLTMR